MRTNNNPGAYHSSRCACWSCCSRELSARGYSPSIRRTSDRHGFVACCAASTTIRVATRCASSTTIRVAACCAASTTIQVAAYRWPPSPVPWR